MGREAESDSLERSLDPERRFYLECPCCGDDGAVSDEDGYFHDGQKLICGCVGWVTIEEEGGAWINNGDEPCPCETTG